jgi:XTP/dITP diphosphohydrolase
VTIFCGTSNPGKLSEFRLAAQQFGNTRFEVQPLPGLAGIEPPREHADSFEENAIQKATYYGVRTTSYLFADDSGLEVDALGGAPGIRSARFAGPDASDEENNRLLLDRLSGVENRRAHFVCAVALVKSGKLIATFRGDVEGRIIDRPRGTNGFGYDPLFWYQPFGCTFGEVGPDRKLEISHRGRALRAMLEALARIIN